MAVSIKQTSDVAAVITVQVSAADYQPQVDKALKNYQKNASIPGFRKGHAPLGLIKKQVGTSVKVEEINRAVVSALFGYIDEEKLQILGNPLPVEDAKEYDFATEENFEFSYDVALAPKIEAKLEKKDKLTYYRIVATKEMEDEQIKRMLENAGKQIEADTVEDNDVVYGRALELADGQPKEGGIEAAQALILASLRVKLRRLSSSVLSSVIRSPSSPSLSMTVRLLRSLHSSRSRRKLSPPSMV